MSGAPTHPRLARELRKVEVATHLGAALLEHGTVKTVAAACIGVRRQRLDEWADPDSARSLSVADLRAMPPAVRHSLLDWMASEMGCTVVERPPAAASLEDDLAVALRVQRATSEAVSAHLAAIADGHVDRAEARTCLQEIEEAEQALGAAKQLMLRAVDEGVVSIRRPARAWGADEAAE